LDFRCRYHGPFRVIRVPEGDVKQSHDCIPNIFVDKRAVPREYVARHAQKGIDHLMGPFGAEIVRQLRK
jgi:hypothetical protein